MLAPPYIFRPTTRLAYCTGILRWARSISTIAPTTITANTMNSNAVMIDMLPVRRSWNVFTRARGRPTTMPAKMINEMPLPTPRSVICSPSHITNAVPVVSVSTVMKRKAQPG